MLPPARFGWESVPPFLPRLLNSSSISFFKSCPFGWTCKKTTKESKATIITPLTTQHVLFKKVLSLRISTFNALENWESRYLSGLLSSIEDEFPLSASSLKFTPPIWGEGGLDEPLCEEVKFEESEGRELLDNSDFLALNVDIFVLLCFCYDSDGECADGSVAFIICDLSTMISHEPFCLDLAQTCRMRQFDETGLPKKTL